MEFQICHPQFVVNEESEQRGESRNAGPEVHDQNETLCVGPRAGFPLSPYKGVLYLSTHVVRIVTHFRIKIAAYHLEQIPESAFEPQEPKYAS